MLQAILVTLLGLTFGQPPLVSYAGAWTAEFSGTTYVRLNLQVTQGHLAGTISVGDTVHVDPHGEVDRVTAAPEAMTAIGDIAEKNGVLIFSRNDRGDVDRFELRLPRPFRLARVP